MGKQLKVISLFSGYGTQELALEYAGINYLNVANCDILKYANEAYDSLHTTEVGNLGDISKIDETTFPACDLLTYSFPCQDLSNQGSRYIFSRSTKRNQKRNTFRIII